MNYNIQKREKHWRQFWQENKVYQFDPQSDEPPFIIDTPPPYVSATHLHAGHIMSYAQAEFIARYKRMAGFNVYYPMGFDDNGLPTERFVEKKYQVNKSKISRSEFIKLCLKETQAGIKNYKQLWQDLGISVDWSKTYSTIDKNSRKIAQWSFIDLFKKDLVYRDKGPIMWCTTCQTAISQADLEDEEKETNFVHIKAKTKEGEPVVFATTRPELLPSCVGISVHPEDKRYEDLIGKTIIMPITGTQVEMTADKIVDPEFGTGIVYFCSSGDKQFLEWEANHPVKDKIYLLNPNGKLNEKAGAYKGLTIKQARKKIIQDLKKIGAIEKIEKLEHAVNTHERCGTDIEYVESKQWFIKLLDHKKELLQQGAKLNWYPKYMKKRYDQWVENLQWDWCISRQRYYGVPFPVWYCQECGEIILPKIENLPVDPVEDKPPLNSCPQCNSQKIIGEKDVMDTWMTSSLTPMIGASLEKEKNLKLYPATLRPQAFEIIRTWLFYTVAKSLYHHQTLPFKDVMISGHGLDEAGEKISKRKHNYQDPEKIIEQYGADAVRYWATGARLGKNMRFSEEEIKNGKRTVVKLWNAACFALPHLENFQPDKDFQPKNKVDIWLLNQLQKTINKCTAGFDSYEYFKVRQAIDKFFWSIFCDNFLEFIKHRLYEQKDPQAKNTLFIGLKNILKLYAPILPFITEELWHKLQDTIPNPTDNSKKKKSIHLESWPKTKEQYLASEKQLKNFDNFLEAIEQVRKHKSKNQIPLGKEIESFKVENKLTSCQQKELKKIMKINNLK